MAGGRESAAVGVASAAKIRSAATSFGDEDIAVGFIAVALGFVVGAIAIAGDADGSLALVFPLFSNAASRVTQI